MKTEGRRMTAYPLFVKDPYFSLWMAGDDPTASDVTFWHGETKPMRGELTVDGAKYRFLGKGEGKALALTGTEVTVFETVYRFQGEGFTFETSYLSPLPLNDKESLARPVCYLRYRFEAEGKHEVTVRLLLDERVCYNTCFREERREEVRVNRFDLGEICASSVELVRQMPLSTTADESGADWGRYFLAGERAGAVRGETVQIYAENTLHGTGTGDILIAFDDVLSVCYFGEYLKGYYFRNGKTVFDALREAHSDADETFARCRAFDGRVVSDAAPFGEDYLFLLYASLRQSIAAHKLVEDGKGRVLFLSKECNSNGCIATADVSYPSVPLYLLYAPELAKGMLLPIFDTAETSVWKFDYAPHDAGVYPYCVGQRYAVRRRNEDALFDLTMRGGKTAETLPFYYQLPPDTDLYDERSQMPVEECGNMIVMSYLYFCASKDEGFALRYLPVLGTWAEHLVEKGLVPAEQLCTDDFSGHLDKNANLALKAVVGISAYGKLCSALGKDGSRYEEIAADYARKWEELYGGEKSSVLNLGNAESWSLKYNMAADCLTGNLFPERLKKRELKRYRELAGKYGVPLDNRNGYAKTDWELWAASMGSEEDVAFVSERIVRFLKETDERVPFPDWYDAYTARRYAFRNRTVQGGLFMPILVKRNRK